MDPNRTDLVRPRTAQPAPVQESVRRIVDGMSQVARDHATLARLELRRDVRKIARDAALIGVSFPALLCGWLLLNAALASLIAAWLTVPGGLALVGLLNALVGGALLASRVRRLATEDKREMAGTREELRRDRTWLSDMKSAGH